MSYDIRFGVKVAGAPDDCYAVIGEPERSSPTYNNSRIFRKSMGWDYKQNEWYKLTDIIPYIEHGIHELSSIIMLSPPLVASLCLVAFESQPQC